MRFLTDGRHFIGPYSPDEPFALARGQRTLRALNETWGVIEIHVIEADTELEARGKWRAANTPTRKRSPRAR